MINEIKRRLASFEAQEAPGEGLMRAAVLLPLYTRDGELHVILTKRTELVEHHKGEISFPGGAWDPTDTHLLATALREADEEVGLKAGHVEIIGRLNDVFSISGFHVAAFVGVIDPARSPYPWLPAADEVAEVLEVPLTHLRDRANYIEVPRQRNGVLTLQEAYRFNGHLVYGLTWRLLRHFLEIAVDEPAEALPLH